MVHRTMGEKNFHVFYALFAGMSRERLLYYFLEDPDCHRYNERFLDIVCQFEFFARKLSATS